MWFCSGYFLLLAYWVSLVLISFVEEKSNRVFFFNLYIVYFNFHTLHITNPGESWEEDCVYRIFQTAWEPAMSISDCRIAVWSPHQPWDFIHTFFVQPWTKSRGFSNLTTELHLQKQGVSEDCPKAFEFMDGSLWRGLSTPWPTIFIFLGAWLSQSDCRQSVHQFIWGCVHGVWELQLKRKSHTITPFMPICSLI